MDILTGDEHKASLVISHFTKRYGSAKSNAVEDFNLSIEGGKIYGFLGKNGAGKSTIIKAIVGMHGFNSGSISVCGYDVVRNPVEAKHEIGFVPDNYALYENLTGHQYIDYVADLYGVSKEDKEARTASLLKRLEMTTHFNDQMKTYSHGMKQKITIMGALIHEPKLWILDEPMTGVDPNSIFQIKECMREHAKKGNIVFFSSHLIDVVENLCDEIVIIKHGHLVMTAKMDDLVKQGIDLETLFLEKTADSEEEVKTLIKEENKFDK
jgi:ABC-2 type transport system ATP-binding protein